MPSHAVRTLLSESPRPDGALELELELVCGCRVRVSASADRVVTTVDGARLAVGKYPCPNGHPVRRPGA